MSTEIQDLEQLKALDHVHEGTFDRGASPTKLKATCRIAKTISEEIESKVEDLRQAKLAL